MYGSKLSFQIDEPYYQYNDRVVCHFQQFRSMLQKDLVVDLLTVKQLLYVLKVYNNREYRIYFISQYKINELPQRSKFISL